SARYALARNFSAASHPAVDRKDGAGRVARERGGEEHGCGCDFVWRRRTTERQRCQRFAPAISIAIALLRLGARQALVAFGGAGAGIDPHDPHAEFVTIR